MSKFIDDIFFTLHNSTYELSMIEFKEFYDLTGKGLNTENLEIDEIMNEFKLADRMGKGKVSKEDLRIYVSKLYKIICDIIYSELSKFNQNTESNQERNSNIQINLTSNQSDLKKNRSEIPNSNPSSEVFRELTNKG